MNDETSDLCITIKHEKACSHLRYEVQKCEDAILEEIRNDNGLSCKLIENKGRASGLNFAIDFLMSRKILNL